MVHFSLQNEALRNKIVKTYKQKIIFTIFFFCRMLSLLYLPAHNAWLILCPWVLAYDWQLGAVPLITTLEDKRNVASLSLYLALALTVLATFRNKQVNIS